jgi:hypothetical protein
MPPFAPILISVVSLLLSLTVAWLTLFRRGTLGMTKPMLIGFLYENEQPKVFFRAMLYATGKRGHIIEALYVKVGNGKLIQTFNFWMYGETKELKIGSGLRVGEDGVSFNHHFMPSKNVSVVAFPEGEYAMDVYARVLNRETPILLSTVKLSLTRELAEALIDHAKGVLFTWGPDSQHYRGDVSLPTAAQGRSRSVSGSGSGKLPWGGRRYSPMTDTQIIDTNRQHLREHPRIFRTLIGLRGDGDESSGGGTNC